MSRLRNFLDRRAANAVALFYSGSALTAADVLARIKGLRGLQRAAANQAVAVWCLDPLEALTLMIALDGVARQLLLIPASTTAGQAREFVQRSGCTHSVGDLSDLLGLLHLQDAGLPVIDTLGSEETRWILTTSGTTNSPKLVSHTFAALAATAKVDTGQGSAFCWGLLYDPARFAGLQVVLQALLGGSALTLASDSIQLEERIDLFSRSGVNAISASPTLWRKLLMSGRAKNLQLKVATLGGEIADQKVLDAIQAAFPQARVRHVYASTEAGVGFSVTDGLEGFPAKWLHMPPRGVELNIIGGELLLRSARTASTYLGGGVLKDPNGWVATGDRVDNDGIRVRFAGRLNGAINVGGDKVFPETIERILILHPGVAAAMVRGKKSAFSGAIVEALVVPSKNRASDAGLRHELIEACRNALPKHAVPALIRFVSEIDMNSSGKQDRNV